MPPKSTSQKTTACMVMAMRQGKLSKDKFPRVAGMMKSLSDEELAKLCRGEVKKAGG